MMLVTESPKGEACPLNAGVEGLLEAAKFEALVAAKLAEGVVVEKSYAGRECRDCAKMVPRITCAQCRLRVARIAVEEGETRAEEAAGERR